jgi:hypothetical protein
VEIIIPSRGEQEKNVRKTPRNTDEGSSLQKLSLIMSESFILKNLRLRLLQAPAKRRSFADSGLRPWAFQSFYHARMAKEETFMTANGSR